MKKMLQEHAKYVIFIRVGLQSKERDFFTDFNYVTPSSSFLKFTVHEKDDKSHNTSFMGIIKDYIVTLNFFNKVTEII